MPNYRRWRKPGGTYFFTVNLLDRRKRLLVEHIDALRTAVATVIERHPFTIDAMVVLPDHLHAVWTLPPGDHDFSTRWRLIKSRFTMAIGSPDAPRGAQRKRGEKGVWQRRFCEHLIRDEEDMIAHVDYIHFNPVKHGHADRPIDWPHSPIHRYVREGILTPDWGTNGAIADRDLD